MPAQPRPRPAAAAPFRVPPRPADAPEVHWTLERANAALPYVRRIAEDVVRDYGRWRTRVKALDTGRAGGVPLEEETRVRLQREVRLLAADLRSHLAELGALGLDCKSLDEGLIDFPSVVDGVPAFLCWKVGEARVEWWHPRDAGFAGRQPVAGAGVAEAGSTADATGGEGEAC